MTATGALKKSGSAMRGPDGGMARSTRIGCCCSSDLWIRGTDCRGNGGRTDVYSKPYFGVTCMLKFSSGEAACFIFDPANGTMATLPGDALDLTSTAPIGGTVSCCECTNGDTPVPGPGCISTTHFDSVVFPPLHGDGSPVSLDDRPGDAFDCGCCPACNYITGNAGAPFSVVLSKTNTYTETYGHGGIRAIEQSMSIEATATTSVCPPDPSNYATTVTLSGTITYHQKAWNSDGTVDGSRTADHTVDLGGLTPTNDPSLDWYQVVDYLLGILTTRGCQPEETYVVWSDDIVYATPTVPFSEMIWYDAGPVAYYNPHWSLSGSRFCNEFTARGSGSGSYSEHTGSPGNDYTFDAEYHVVIEPSKRICGSGCLGSEGSALAVELLAALSGSPTGAMSMLDAYLGDLV